MTLLALTPPEFVFHMTAEEMARPDTTVFIARDSGKAVACGALRRHENGIGEVKRMYTRPSHQGQRDRPAAFWRRSKRWRGAKGCRASCSRRATAIRQHGASTSAAVSSAAARCSTIRTRATPCSTRRRLRKECAAHERSYPPDARRCARGLEEERIQFNGADTSLCRGHRRRQCGAQCLCAADARDCA